MSNLPPSGKVSAAAQGWYPQVAHIVYRGLQYTVEDELLNVQWTTSAVQWTTSALLSADIYLLCSVGPRCSASMWYSSWPAIGSETTCFIDVMATFSVRSFVPIQTWSDSSLKVSLTWRYMQDNVTHQCGVYWCGWGTGAFGVLVPTNWIMRHYKSVEFLSNFRMLNTPTENFLAWRRFWWGTRPALRKMATLELKSSTLYKLKSLARSVTDQKTTEHRQWGVS